MICSDRNARRTTRALLLMLLLGSLSAGLAQAQAVNCEAALAEAEERYNRGRFDEVISQLNTCLERGAFAEADLPQVHRLLSHCYLGKQLADQAKEAVGRLLELAPNYQPDPIQDLPAFATMVEEMKALRQAAPPQDDSVAEDEPAADDDRRVVRPDAGQDEEPPPLVTEPPRRRSGMTRWLIIGGGAVAAGALAAVLAGGGGGDGGGPITPPPTGATQLPGPPTLPGGN